MADANQNGAALLDSLRPELLKAFRDIPASGQLALKSSSPKARFAG
jgi:hypothetical protein